MLRIEQILVGVFGEGDFDGFGLFGAQSLGVAFLGFEHWDQSILCLSEVWFGLNLKKLSYL